MTTFRKQVRFDAEKIRLSALLLEVHEISVTSYARKSLLIGDKHSLVITKKPGIGDVEDAR